MIVEFEKITGEELSKKFLPEHLAQEIQRKKKKLTKNKTRNIWGRKWKYAFDFDSQKDNVSIGWVPNMTPNDKVGFTVGFKMSGLCGKNILVNSWVDAGFMLATYNKPSKRLYVRLYTDFYNNYNVNFF
jgi:hypothetical protein